MSEIFKATSNFKPNDENNNVFKATKDFIPTKSQALNDLVSTTHQPIKFGTGGRVINGTDKDFKNVLKGNPIPHVNPTATSSNSFGKEKALAGIRSKLQKGKVLTTFELQQVDMFGGMSEVAGNNQKFIFDISARDNPSNTALWNAAKSAMDKEIKGIKLTEEENNAISTYKLIDEFNKSLAKYNSSLTEDTNLNRQKQVSAKAQGLYNDSAYDDNHVNLGNKEITVDKSDKFSSFAGKVQKQENRLDLYMNTGFAQYGEGVNTTLELLTAFVSGKEMSDVTNSISNRPDGAYSVASGILKQYYQENGERLNSVVQDVVTNMANNLPAMAVSLAGGAMGMSAWITSALSQGLVFAPSVFGNAYKEGTKFGVSDPTKLFCYATSITAAETGLGYLLDGVTGAATKGLADNVSKSIKNVFLKTIFKGVIRGGGEFLEESTQSVLAPLLQSWILDANVDTILTDPIESLKGAAYEGFIGMLSAWIMGGVGDFGSAVNESQIQQYGNYCIDIMSKTDTDIKNIATYLMKVNEKKSDVYKSAEKVSKGDSSSFAVGDMMNKAAIAAKESQNFLYATIGKSIKEKPNGITQVIDTFESLKNEGLIFPSKIEDLYLGIKDSISVGVDIKDEIIGEFAVSVQTYSPRAIIMRDLVKTIENEKPDIDTESDYNNNNAENNRESVFTEYSAEAPDPNDKYITKDNGYQFKDSRQRHIEKVSDKFGIKVIWKEDVSRGKYIPSKKMIVLNPNMRTSEMYNFVFKHEFTHYLEGKQGYDGFKKYCFSDSPAFEKWVRDRLDKSGISSTGSRGEVIQRLTKISFDVYKNSNEISMFFRNKFTMEDAEAEVLADFVGESLLGTGEHLEETLDMLNDLNHRHRGIFERIRDFVRDMINRFKGNSKFKGLVSDLEYLNERLKRVAESDNKKISDNVTEKYSIEYTTDNKPVAVIDENILDGVPKSQWVQTVKNIIAEKFSSGIPISGRLIKVNKITRSEFTNSKYSKYLKSSDGTIYQDKLKTANNLDDIVLASTNYINEDLKHSRNDSFKEFARGDVLIRVSGNDYSAKVIVGFTNSQQMVLYDVIDFNQTSFKIKERTSRTAMQNAGSDRNVMSSDITVPQKAQSVKNNISENTENDTEKNSIVTLPIDELLDKYDRGEITREEYLKETDSMTRRAAFEYLNNWERENALILSSQKRLDNEREKAVELEREEQQMRKDRESNIGAIRRTVRKLDHALRANTNAKHIPESYKNVVTGFCKLFVDNDKATFEHKELADIYAYYSSMKGDGETIPDAPQYDPYIDELLKGLIDTLTGKKLTNLNNLELNYLRTITDALNFIVDHELELFIDGKKAKYEEIGKAALNDIENSKPIKFVGALMDEADEKIREFFYEGNMLPGYFLKRMGGTFEKVFNDFINGENKWARNMEISRKFVEDVKSKYDYAEWKDTAVSFRTESGHDITISIDQAMQLVATAQRERSNNGQKAKHLSIGGVVIDIKAIKDALKKQRRKKADISAIWDSVNNKAIQISFKDADVISAMLTDAQKGYIKEIVDFLSTQCAAWGNEVTMEQYGYRQFNESNYFPYVSSELFLTKDPAKAESTILRRASFTHSLQKNANNPLILTSFTDIALQHIESMCNFNAMTVPLETLNKIFNYKTESNEDVAPRSVKAEMKNVFGSGAVEYMHNLINDLNTGVRGEQRDGFINKWISRFKKNAVLANLSVIVQQPWAVLRATSDIDVKYFAAATKYLSKNNYEECKQYAPVAIIKQMGRFDTGVGVKNTTWLSGEKTFFEKADDALGWGAGKADEIAWSFLWNSVKAEIADTTNLKVGSEEFLTKAGERFTELVNKTQVYDSVLTKSQNMRNKGLVGAITSFAGEPTVSVNMLADSFLDFTEGKIGGKQFARVITAVTTAEIVTAIAQSLVTAARDDDEDKSYLEKYLKNVVANSLSNVNLAGKIPFIRDLMSIWEGYDIERQDVALFADFLTAVKTLANKNKTWPEKIRGISEALAALYGVPLKNVLRDIEATVKTIQGFVIGKEKTDADGVKVSLLEGISENNILKPLGVEFFDFSKSGEYERMAKAAKRGDEDTYSESYNRLIKNGAEDSEIRTGITNEFKSDKTVKKQSANYNKELKQSDTFNSFSDDDKEKLSGQVTSALAKEVMVKATERAPDEYDRLYDLYRNNKPEYKKLKEQMLEEGKTKRQIEDGFEIARYAYLKSAGIDLHEYLLYKMAISEKYADKDNSGGISYAEKKAVVDNMDIDEETRKLIRNVLLKNN